MVRDVRDLKRTLKSQNGRPTDLMVHDGDRAVGCRKLAYRRTAGYRQRPPRCHGDEEQKSTHQTVNIAANPCLSQRHPFQMHTLPATESE